MCSWSFRIITNIILFPIFLMLYKNRIRFIQINISLTNRTLRFLPTKLIYTFPAKYYVVVPEYMRALCDDWFNRLSFAYPADVYFVIGFVLFYHHLFLHFFYLLGWVRDVFLFLLLLWGWVYNIYAMNLKYFISSVQEYRHKQYNHLNRSLNFLKVPSPSFFYSLPSL